MAVERTQREQEIHDMIKQEYPLTYPIAVALVLVTLGILIGAALFGKGGVFSADNGYGANVYTSVISTIVTVGFIDRLNRRRDERRARAQEQIHLVAQIRGAATKESKQACLFEMKERELLTGADFRGVNLEGVTIIYANLKHTKLVGANLENADLRYSNFSGSNLMEIKLEGANLEWANLNTCNLQGANFSGAKYTEEQLAKANSLWDATMYNGKKYDGRYNLQGDIKIAHEAGINVDNPEDLARFYGVSDKDFKIGQQWRRMKAVVLN